MIWGLYISLLLLSPSISSLRPLAVFGADISNRSMFLCSALLHRVFRFNHLKPPRQLKENAWDAFSSRFLSEMTGRGRQRGSQKGSSSFSSLHGFQCINCGDPFSQEVNDGISTRTASWATASQPGFLFLLPLLVPNAPNPTLNPQLNRNYRQGKKKKRAHGNKQTKIAEGEERQTDGMTDRWTDDRLISESGRKR